jgi:hypothetical protein
VFVRQISERSILGLATRLELLKGDDNGRHEGGRDQEKTHDQGGDDQHFAGVADTSLRTLRVVPLVAAHERHHAHPGLETREPQGQLREDQERHADHRQWAAVAGEQRSRPVDYILRVRGAFVQADGNDDEVQQQVDRDQ